jgi:acyl dehydratase
MGIYLEDLVVGAPVELGSHTFTRAEVIEFARKYDPQPFHLDDEAARRSLFGSLSASGWHTAAIWLRLLVDNRNREGDFMRFRGERPARYGPSPGFEQLKWLKPVLVGDTLRFTSRVREKRDVRSRPEVGLVIYDNEGINQKGELVFQITSKVLVERRHPLKADA